MDGKLTIHVTIETGPGLVHEVLRVLRPSLPFTPTLPTPTAKASEQAVPQQQPESSTGAGATAKPAGTTKSCEWCGQLYVAKTATQKFDTPQCQEKAKRHREIERRIEANGQAEASAET
jgi:hypothetical protein